jgi:hypothetical protein
MGLQQAAFERRAILDQQALWRRECVCDTTVSYCGHQVVILNCFEVKPEMQYLSQDWMDTAWSCMISKIGHGMVKDAEQLEGSTLGSTGL